MNFKLLFHNHKWFILLSLGYFLSRLLFLNTDWHVLEPDEIDYTYIAQQFQENKWPYHLRGFLYVEQIPLFPALAALLDLATRYWGIWIAGRLLSIIGGFLGGWALWRMGKAIKKEQLGLVAAGLFWFTPLSLFYTRMGTLDMFALGWVLVSIALFIGDQRKDKQAPGNLLDNSLLRIRTAVDQLIATISNKWSWIRINSTTDSSYNKSYIILSGLAFILAILTKSALIVFLLSFLVLFFFNSFRYKQSLLRFLVVISIGIASIHGVFLLFFWSEWLSQSIDMPRRHLLPLLNLRVHIAVVWEYLVHSPFWLSWSLVCLFIVGSIVLVKKELIKFFYDKKEEGILARLQSFWLKISQETQALPFQYLQLTITLALATPALFFLILFDFSPRYFLLILPSLSWIASIGFVAIWKSSFRYALLLLFISFIPLWQAWLGTQHTAIRDITQHIKKLKGSYSSAKVYTTFDPEKWEYMLGEPVTWLSKEALQGDSIVIVDERKSELYESFTEPEFKEMNTVKWLLKEKQKIWTYTDPYPHFPVTDSGNVFKVYLITQ